MHYTEVSVQLHFPAALAPGKDCKGSWVGPRTGQKFWKTKKLLAPAVDRDPDRPVRSLVTKPTALSRLLRRDANTTLHTSTMAKRAFRIPASQSCIYDLELISLVQLKAVDTSDDDKQKRSSKATYS